MGTRRPQLDRGVLLERAPMVLVGAALGFVVAGGGMVGALVAALPLAACLLVLPPIVTCIVAAVLPWIARPLTTTGLAPRLVDFVDFPLVLVALATAIIARPRRPLDRAQVELLRSIGLFAAAITLSWIVNPSSPLRLLAGLLLIMQPFLLVAALVVTRPSAAWRRVTFAAFAIVMLVQVPVAVVQNAGSSDPDDVKGTLFEANAGHHVMAGAAMLTAFVIVAVVHRRGLVVVGVLVAIALGIMADGKQVFFAAPFGVLMLLLFLSRGHVAAGAGRRLAAVLVLAASVIGLVAFGATDSLTSFVENTRETRGGKIALTEAMIEDLAEDPLQGAFGFGPGSTVSRFGYLSSVLVTDGNPIETLGIGPGSRTVEYDELTQGSGFIGESSFSSGQSSLLGVIGDFGVVGITAFGLMLLALFRALWRTPSPLAAAAAAGWTMLIPLGFIFDWLEQPPYTLLLALITGLALTETEAQVPA